jgi:alcohol dehydrogenase
MKVAAIQAHGDIDQIKYDDWPDPEAGPGEALIRVRACGLNYLDLFVLKGMPGLPVEMPRVSGGDIAGDVAALGEGVGGVEIGQRVLVDPALGRFPSHAIGENTNGGLCELIAVPAENLIPLSDKISYEDAASLPIAYGTAWRMMVTRGKVAPYEKVLILGASGGVGTACVQIGRMVGATVYAAAGSDAKLERLKELGADYGINYTKDDLSRTAWALSGKKGMDVIVNFTGGDTWAPSIRTLAIHGRMLTCGATAGFDPPTDIRYIWRREVTIIGSDCWLRSDLETLLDLVQRKKIKPVIHKVFPLSETREAFRTIQDREVFGKVIVTP